ncbi:hypothetical protein HJG60_011534 [Phyllostomus discolor]|uniref:Histone-lysine N-methyltransferase SETMAR-like n=1 Tax=Phyllostomus discolor TaxID=89673 RepID=A0A834E380_9CHIR|nr:hypothetical protein HJG60_011534 [Phyllostomus discolor]
MSKMVCKVLCWRFPWSGRPVEVDSDQINTLIENNQHSNKQEIANILKISKSSVENYLYELGYVNCFDIWVPYKLSEENLLHHVSTCDSLLKCNGNVPFLKQIVMKSGYFTIMWNERDRGASEMSHHQPHQRPIFVKEGDVVCVVGLEGSPLQISYEPLPEN